MSRKQVLVYLLLSNQCMWRFFIVSIFHVSLFCSRTISLCSYLSSMPFQANFLSSTHEKKSNGLVIYSGLYWNNRELLICAVLQHHLFKVGSVMTHDSALSISWAVPEHFLCCSLKGCYCPLFRWLPMQVSPRAHRKMWLIIRFLVMLNLVCGISEHKCTMMHRLPMSSLELFSP